MALSENIAIFRRNIPCPWNMLQDRLIPGIVDGYRKVLGRVCIKAQSGIFCLQRRTMGMDGAQGGPKGPSRSLRQICVRVQENQTIFSAVSGRARRPMETQEGQSNDQSACLLQSPLLIRGPPLLTIVLHLATLIAVISRKYVKAIFYTLYSQQQGTINNRNDCKYLAKNISLPAFSWLFKNANIFLQSGQDVR